MQLRQQCLHRWRKIVFSEDQVLEEFTPQIRRDIVNHVNKDSLKKISFLEKLLVPHPQLPDLQPLAKEFAIGLATKLLPSVTAKGDNLCSAADEGGDMYIIMLGSCTVMSTTRRTLDALEGAGSVNELGMLSECMTEQSLTEDETAFLIEHMPPEFKDLDLADLLPLQHTKTYHADTGVETLQLRKADLRDAVDRTNDKDGFSILRSALVHIFVDMLTALNDRDKRILVQKTMAKKEANERRVLRLQQKGAEGFFASRSRTTPTGSGMVKSPLVSRNAFRRHSGSEADILRRNSGTEAEEMNGLLEKMKAVNSSIESQATELREFMRAVGLEPPIMAPGDLSPQNSFISGGAA